MGKGVNAEFGKHRRVYRFRYYCTEDKDIELQDGTNIIFLNFKGYGDAISPEVADMLNLMEGKPVQTEYGKALAAEKRGDFSRLVLNVKTLMVNLHWSAVKALDALNVPEEERQAVMVALGKK